MIIVLILRNLTLMHNRFVVLERQKTKNVSYLKEKSPEGCWSSVSRAMSGPQLNFTASVSSEDGSIQ
jgi:hypothetical protein